MSKIESQMLAEARAEVAVADQKAGLVLAGAGIGFGAVIGGLLAGDWRPGEYEPPGEILWWLGAVFAFGVILSAAYAIWPRFTTRDEDELITYWGHVARFTTLEALTSALDEVTSVDRDRTRHQLWRLARIVRLKYQCVRVSLVSGACAAILFLLAGLIG